MNHDSDFTEDFIFDLNDVPPAKNNTDNSFCGANTEASPQNFSDGYLYDGDIPRAKENNRPIDLLYDGKYMPSSELIVEDMDSIDIQPPPQVDDEYRPRAYRPDYSEVDYEASIESLDGETATPADTAAEAELRAEQIYNNKIKYQHEQVDLYKDRVYDDDIGRSEQGEKIARIIGIDLIAIAAIAVVSSFFNGTFVDFLAPVIRIIFCVLFMKGYKIGRYLTIFTAAVSMYTPIVFLTVSDGPMEPWRKAMYIFLLIMYAVILYFLIRSKEIKDFCTKEMVSPR